MDFKLGNKYKATKCASKVFNSIKQNEIFTIAKIKEEVVFLQNIENPIYYVWIYKENFNKYFIPFKEDIIEYQGKKYDIYQKTDYRYTDGTHNLSLLLKEHKEEILDDIEKEYLRNAIKYVIEPTKVKILNIIKDFSNGYYYITIRYYSKKLQIMNYVTLPAFTDKRMYKDMKLNKAYTLEELGL